MGNTRREIQKGVRDGMKDHERGWDSGDIKFTLIILGVYLLQAYVAAHTVGVESHDSWWLFSGIMFLLIIIVFLFRNLGFFGTFLRALILLGVWFFYIVEKEGWEYATNINTLFIYLIFIGINFFIYLLIEGILPSKY